MILLVFQLNWRGSGELQAANVSDESKYFLEEEVAKRTAT